MSILITNSSTSSGSSITPTNNQTASYTLTSSDQTVVFSTGSSNLTATLPSAVGISGKIYNIVKSDTGTGYVAIDTTSSQTIGSISSGTILLASQNDSIQVVSDGSNWQIIEFNVAVVMKYTNNSSNTQTVNSATQTTLTLFTTKLYDTYNAYNTGTGAYTVPISGRYSVMFSVVTDGAATFTANQSMQAQLLINGVQESTAFAFVYSSGTSTVSVDFSDTFYVSAGQTISTALLQNLNNSAVAVGGNYMFLSIERIGN